MCLKEGEKGLWIKFIGKKYSKMKIEFLSKNRIEFISRNRIEFIISKIRIEFISKNRREGLEWIQL